ncbi:MAG: hypothetical protein ACI4EF_06240, partial [Coprococcus sp.]
MKIKYKRQVIGGACTGILVWVILTIADAFDELILDADCYIGAFVLFSIPIIMFIYYIVHYIKHRPKAKNLLIWFGSFYLVCLPLWWIIYNMICENRYIIKQRDRSDWIN